MSARIQSACLCLFLLCGCERARLTPEIRGTISGSEIESTLQAEGIYGFPLLADKTYSVPTLNWFENEFPREWEKFSQNLLGHYAAEVRDCDDFARAAAFLAQLLHSRSISSPLSALAVGEFWYDSRQGPHAIVAAICRRDTNLVVVFFEPQSPARVVALTRAEYESCRAVRF